MLRMFIMLGLLCAWVQPAYAVKITPSHVYAQGERVLADIQSIKKHFKLKGKTSLERINVEMKPRHVWQKTYEILIKLNIFYKTKHYPTIAISSLEPIADIQPALVYDQTQRILAELQLIKKRFNITAQTPATRQYYKKTPRHVYQLLSRASAEVDIINHQSFTPSEVFSQVIRINNDIDIILTALDINDTSFPPVKNFKSQPFDAFQVGFALMQTIGQIQRSLNIPVTDFSGLKKETIQPADVFALISLISAELQPIKHALSLNHIRTPFSNTYNDKKPGDVEQVLGWCHNKLKQIRKTQL